MKHGKFHRATTLVVTGMLVFGLAWFDGCGGYVGAGGSGGNSITGIVVDDQTKSPVAGAVVVLEQPDGGGIDRVIASTTSASNGSFSFSPPATGVFDVVADATVISTTAAPVTYAATVTFGVLSNANLNQVPLVPEFGNTTPIGNPIRISNRVSSSGSSVVQSAVDIKLSVLLLVSPPVGSVQQITIPTFAGSIPAFTGSNTIIATVPTDLSCASNTACVSYSLLVPAGNFSFGTFSSSGTQYTLSSQTADVNYTVEGSAFAPGSTLAQACNPSIRNSAITITSGIPGPPNPALAFTLCP